MASNARVLMSYAAKFHSQFLRTVPRGGRFGAEDGQRPRRPRQLPDRSGARRRRAAVRGARCGRRRRHPDGEARPALSRHPAPICRGSSRSPGRCTKSAANTPASSCWPSRAWPTACSAHREAWTAFVRAGASMIISYGARHAREWLGGMSQLRRNCSSARRRCRRAACIHRCARSRAWAARRAS